jgi:hypothetical protein
VLHRYNASVVTKQITTNRLDLLKQNFFKNTLPKHCSVFKRQYCSCKISGRRIGPSFIKPAPYQVRGIAEKTALHVGARSLACNENSIDVTKVSPKFPPKKVFFSFRKKNKFGGKEEVKAAKFLNSLHSERKPKFIRRLFFVSNGCLRSVPFHRSRHLSTASKTG